MTNYTGTTSMPGESTEGKGYSYTGTQATEQMGSLIEKQWRDPSKWLTPDQMQRQNERMENGE